MIAHSGPWLTEEDQAAITSVMARGQLAQGPAVACFEAALADYLRAGAVIAVGSGAAALALALHALDISSGDEVILPTYVCFSVAQAVKSLGAVPVLCDIGEQWVMTAESVAAKITRRTKAVIVVHIFGILADTPGIESLGAPVIEDFCQAFGGKYGESSFPITSRLAFFSFNAGKCLAAGEGGAVATNDDGFAVRLRALRASRLIPAPLSDLSAALGLSQLKRCDLALARRRSMADYYFQNLPPSLTEKIKQVEKNVFFRFPLWRPSGPEFEEVKQLFAARDVAVRLGVDDLLHRWAGLADQGFENAAAALKRTLSIPIRPGLSPAELEQIVRAVKDVL